MVGCVAVFDIISLEVLFLDWRSFVSIFATCVLSIYPKCRGRAYWVVGRELPDRTPPRAQETASQSTGSSTAAPRYAWINLLPQDLGADIFKGQVITIAVVIVFLTIFLLREWIIQNARPGVFGDDDIPDAPVAPDAAPAEAVQEHVPGADIPDDLLLFGALQDADAHVEPAIIVDPPAEQDQLDIELREALPSSSDSSTDEDDSDSVSVQSRQDTVSLLSNPGETSKSSRTESECPGTQCD